MFPSGCLTSRIETSAWIAWNNLGRSIRRSSRVDFCSSSRRHKSVIQRIVVVVEIAFQPEFQLGKSPAHVDSFRSVQIISSRSGLKESWLSSRSKVDRKAFKNNWFELIHVLQVWHDRNLKALGKSKNSSKSKQSRSHVVIQVTADHAKNFRFLFSLRGKSPGELKSLIGRPLKQ